MVILRTVSLGSCDKGDFAVSACAGNFVIKAMVILPTKHRWFFKQRAGDWANSALVILRTEHSWFCRSALTIFSTVRWWWQFFQQSAWNADFENSALVMGNFPTVHWRFVNSALVTSIFQLCASDFSNSALGMGILEKSALMMAFFQQCAGDGVFSNSALGMAVFPTVHWGWRFCEQCALWLGLSDVNPTHASLSR